MATTEPQPLYFRTLDSQPWERGDREAAGEWQQARLFHAMTRAVSEKGYAKVTVADVVALAGVSRRTFYEHFADVEDCFVAAYETATREILGEVGEAVRAARATDWRERFEVAIAAYVESLASDPHMARACLVDVQGAGPRAVEMRRHVYEQFVGRHAGAAQRPRGRPRGDPADPGAGRRGRDRRARAGAHLRQGRRITPGADPHARRIGWALLESPFELPRS